MIKKIDELVGDGIRNVHEMKRALRNFVIKDLFDGQQPPSNASRRFFPENRDIYNHMYRSRMNLVFSKLDQENLFAKIKKWKKTAPDDNFYFREYGKKSKERLFFNENANRIPTVR